MQSSRDESAKNRGARLEARISTEQKALFQQAATLSARSLSKFVVASAQEAAGYLSYSNRHADLLFELISRRFEHKSTVSTTNRAFKELQSVFPKAACVRVFRVDGHIYSSPSSTRHTLR